MRANDLGLRAPPPHRVSRWLAASADATPRGVIEFATVAAVLLLGDPTPTSLVVGGVISAVGELLRIVAAGYGYNLGEMSVRGPYRYVRHPHFLGSALLFVGLCVASRQPFVAGGALTALALLYRFAVRADEVRCKLRLGPRYADYRAKVPAFMPTIWPPVAAEHDGRAFSLRYALFAGRHREFNAVLGLAAAFGLLYLAQSLPSRDVYQLGMSAMLGVYLVGRILYFSLLRRPGRRPAAAETPLRSR
jgi:protein-S-isoprenylcysteine O-methyltransferase Ste14